VRLRQGADEPIRKNALHGEGRLSCGSAVVTGRRTLPTDVSLRHATLNGEDVAVLQGFPRRGYDANRQKATPVTIPRSSLVTTDSPIVKAILRASEVMLGKPAETYYSPSAFDQGYLNHVGIVTANFGAGEHQYAHTDYDMASVERTADAAKVYAFMMLDYLT